MTQYTVDIQPEADTRVIEPQPNNNLGSNPELMVWGELGQRQRSLLRFDLLAIPTNSTITAAILNLHAIDSNIDACATGTETYVILDVTNRTWTEMGTTWNNQPSISPTYPGIQIMLPHISNYNISIDITPYIIDQFGLGNKADFMIKSLNETSPNCFVRLSSREAGPTNTPFIRVTSVTTPANVISTTLTVDTNDCVTPCTVNGTVRWTNTGGTVSDPTDLSITVNGIPTLITSAIMIGPGETTAVYPFTISNLAADTYTVQAFPNTGTVSQIITVNTPAIPANIVSTGITATPRVLPCVQSCTVDVSVTWTNNGGSEGSFVPSINIDGTPISPAQYPSELLAPGASIVHTFVTDVLAVGPHQICADPNGTCTTINIFSGPSIAATGITTDKTSCTSPCDVTVNVTWTNTGDVDGTFIPSINIDSIPIDPSPYPPEILSAGTNVTHIFGPITLVAGTYNICSNPNTLPCTTVIVLSPANVISTTLTVDTNDCVAPCTVNGTVSWTNTGGVVSSPTDLGITVNGVLRILDSAVTINPGETLPYTFSIPNLVAGTYNICSNPNTLPCTTVIVLSPANVISTDLTVDTNDCVAPCIVNGTVSWTNTGGIASIPTDLSITVNGIPALITSAIMIGPGETTAVYPFTISNLIAGTYTIQASPNAGTAPQTIIVRSTDMVNAAWNYYPDGWTLLDRNAKIGNVNLFHKGLIPILWLTGFGSAPFTDWWIMVLRLYNNNWNQYYNNTTCAPGQGCRTNLGSFFYEFPKESNNVLVEFLPGEWIEGSTFTVGKVGIWGPEPNTNFPERRYWGFFGLVPDTTIYSIDMHTGFNIAIPENVDSFCNNSYDLLSGISRNFVTGDIFNYNVSNGILFGISTGPCAFNGYENFVLVVKSNGVLYRGNYSTNINPGTQQHSLSVRSLQGNTILSVDGIDRVTVPAIPFGKLKPLWGIASFSDNSDYGSSSPEVYFKNINIVLSLPADIVATSITPSKTTCTEPCDLTIDVTYTNIGQVSGTFTPKITIDGVSYILAPDILVPNDNVVKTFSKTGLMAGTHTICAEPPGTTTCQTIIVNTPAIPANIVSTGITATPRVLPCVQSCTVDVSVTWTNNGGSEGSFVPSINIDGTPISPAQYPSELLAPGASIVHTFVTDVLAVGPHQICADPNGTCATINIFSGPSIAATGITADKTSCTSPCDVTVNVTWTNTGDVDGTFTPSIKVDDIPMSPVSSSETLAIDTSVTHTFSATGLAAGSHTICADPDSGTCVTVNVLTPANITATTIVPNKTTCTAPCDITVDITWTNNGETSGTFIPTITVDGTPTTLPEESLGPGLSVTTTFPITGLMAGTYNICSYPNTLLCTTVTVTVATVEAGIGPLLGFGLLFGILISKKCKDYNNKKDCEKHSCRWIDERNKCVTK